MAQHVSDQDVEVCKQTRDADCCLSSKVKKTTDISKIKSSQDANTRNRCCDIDASRDIDNERDTLEDASEKKKPCCSRDKKTCYSRDKKGICAKQSKAKPNTNADTDAK